MITDLSRLPDDSESAFVRCDCMDLMARYPDGYFDIAIVDPPYGISVGHNSEFLGGVLQKYQYMGTAQKH